MSAIVTTPTDREIRIERRFNAPRALVWRAMTEPELLKKWWGRGHPMEIPVFEFVRGGHYRFEEHHDGRVDGFEGRFGEIVAPERMMQTFEWDGYPAYPARLTIALEDHSEQTQMVETMLFFTTEERDGMLQSGMEQGMEQSLTELDKLLAELK